MKSWEEVKESKNPRDVYLFNKLDPQFNYEEAINILLEKDYHGGVLFYFFKNWGDDVPKKYKNQVIDKIIERDKSKSFILKIYETWKLTKAQKDKIKPHLNFNKIIYQKYVRGSLQKEKAIEELSKLDNSSFWIDKINKDGILKESKRNESKRRK